MKHARSFKKITFILIALMVMVGYGLLVVYANAPAGGYTPGETLNPDCGPTDTDCFVLPPVTYGGTITTGHSDQILYLDGTGQLVSDNNFTRDYSTNNTNILRQYAQGLDTITTGIQSNDTFIFGATGGTTFSQSDGTNTIFNGVFDITPFGGSSLTAGIVYLGVGGGSVTRLTTPQYVQDSMEDINGNKSIFTLQGTSFDLSVNPAGNNNDYGFTSHSGHPAWYFNNTYFELPIADGTSGQVLSTNGSAQLSWVTASAADSWAAYTVPSDGTSGQVLSTNGSGLLSWIDAGGIFPDQTGHDGEFLTTNSGILSWASNIGSYVPLSYMGANNGVATLDANGKIPSSQLAALAINNSFVVNSEVDMLALNAIQGDIAVRTDISSSFVLSSNDPTQLSDWIQLLWEPTVVTVNGQTGNVSLTTDNITEGVNNLYFTTSRVNSAITAYLPNQAGNAGRVLSTNGNGSLSWVVQGGGPGGSGPMYLNDANTIYSGDTGAGEGDVWAGNNVFLGGNAGGGSFSTSYANLIGFKAGENSLNVSYSNFFGNYAGYEATNANTSNFLGYNAGRGATNANTSNFFGYSSGENATNASHSNFVGYQAGFGATDADYSNFIGVDAGYGAVNATNSFFVGSNSGYGATNATLSNFIGSFVGYEAINAAYSNFVGEYAGYGATDAHNSNFFGIYAGHLATGAYSSNFIGASAGFGATSAFQSNFIGEGAGYGAIDANNSNFFGEYAGYGATNAYISNFIGASAGNNAINASLSNFIGSNAGRGATDAFQSNFFGINAGRDATNASSSNFFGVNAGFEAIYATYSNFVGEYAGYGATNAAYSNFLGLNAGYGATDAGNSNFFGPQAGQNATNASDSNFFGNAAGFIATNASYSNFFGYNAGYAATDASNSNFFGPYAGNGATNAGASNFIGMNTGENAINASYSNFIGWRSGYVATNASFANFFGYSAGNGATNAAYSNFLGLNAGYGATDAGNSNFFGPQAGQNATNASDSNFFGNAAGFIATNASYSNFFGYNAGSSATNASNSNFFGYQAGLNATNAKNAIFLGQNSGNGDIVNNGTNDWSILIGRYTKTGGFNNSILLGGSTSTSFVTNTKSNQFMLADTITDVRWRGVEYSLPSAQAGAADYVLTNNGSGVLTWEDPNLLVSDERLKSNIIDISNGVLENLQNLRTVTYTLTNDPVERTQIGFLAQDMESHFPELVGNLSDGYKGVYYAQMTPILVKAIQEMNFKIVNINDMTKPNSWRDALIAWFGNVENGITDFFTKTSHTETLCVGTKGDETCINKAQLDQLLQGSNNSNTIILPPSGNTGGDTGSNDNTGSDNTDPGTVTPPTDNPPAGPSSGDSGSSTGDSGIGTSSGDSGSTSTE